MALVVDREFLLDRLDEALRTAPRATPDLFAKVIAVACPRIFVLNASGKPAGIEQLIDSGAWIDSALALIELELPLWKIRRIAYEGGEWFCSLSRAPNLPLELDDSVDTSHDVPALAVLRALIEAQRRIDAERRSLPTVPVPRCIPQHVSRLADAICCDNFA